MDKINELAYEEEEPSSNYINYDGDDYYEHQMP
jgi:hypothetical protein